MYRRYRKPSLLNTLLYRLSMLPPFNPFAEFPMPISRRYTLIRAVATISGDIAAGVAVATACTWLIEFATLGVFLSFLTWLVGTLAALALSQYVVHPAVSALLCDHKLDAAFEALSTVVGYARSVMEPPPRPV